MADDSISTPRNSRSVADSGSSTPITVNQTSFTYVLAHRPLVTEQIPADLGSDDANLGVRCLLNPVKKNSFFQAKVGRRCVFAGYTENPGLRFASGGENLVRFQLDSRKNRGYVGNGLFDRPGVPQG